MNNSYLVLIGTWFFSGLGIIISIINLKITNNISKNEAYLNTITVAREKWMNELKVNTSSYFSIVDTFFLLSEDSLVNKYEEMLKYQYAISITLYQYPDDIEIKENMKQIQTILYEYINNDDFNITLEKKEEIISLKNDIRIIVNKKYEDEWNKQKAEVNGTRFIKRSNH